MKALPVDRVSGNPDHLLTARWCNNISWKSLSLTDENIIYFLSGLWKRCNSRKQKHLDSLRLKHYGGPSGSCPSPALLARATNCSGTRNRPEIEVNNFFFICSPSMSFRLTTILKCNIWKTLLEVVCRRPIITTLIGKFFQKKKIWDCIK